MPRSQTDSLRPRMPGWARLVLVALAGIFLAQTLWAANRDSVTIDEFVHLPVGLNAWYHGDFRIDPINPHLPRMIAALPLLLHPPAFSPAPEGGHWGMGYDLANRNSERYQALFVEARAMIALIGVLLGAVVFSWGRELYGWRAGLASAALFAVAPSMLAHGHLVTLDMAGAFGFTLSVYACWRLMMAPSRSRAVALGVALGLANLFKLSSFVLIIVVLGLIAWRAATARHTGTSAGAWFGHLILAGLVALAVLNLGYGFDGTFALLAEARLADGGLLANLERAAPWLRFPLPLPVIDGIDMILNVGKTSEPSYFLAGELSAEGWWYYHLAAFALKTPLPLLALSLWALVRWLGGYDRAPLSSVVWVAVVAIFAANSAFNSLAIGVRHVLAAVPLLLIPCGGVVAATVTRWNGARVNRSAVGAGIAALLCLWLAAESLSVAPRYLQYCNQIAGSADGCHEWLVDSNIDWGQDLLRLREYIDERQLAGVHLAYFGRVDPLVYGIRYAPLHPTSSGTAVISASFLMGRPYFWFVNGRYGWARANTYAWMRDKQPVDRVGSLLVYELP
ncbi:MAG: 4-amino-4-deoxy-L-arabinose transferase-like glycosyltransferase [Hyphomicrobiaceae bacterium]|jgi:4-amino-4-deoxy-L-arabinose transferase-like glycosyltransferase